MVDAATDLLLRSAAGVSIQQAREPSQLTGWSRGHLLTHVARNADSLRNLLVWARTGVETPQYSHPTERAEGIAAGADRSSAELLADLEGSAAALDAEAARLPDTAWAAQVGAPATGMHPAWYTLWRRLSELEIHHVDLGLGYRVTDWPAEFASQCLERVAGDFAKPDSPAAVLRSADDGSEHRIGPEGAPAMVTISGPTRELLAWLIGRSPGGSLVTEPAGPLPHVPSW
jgi:maleylpyruvate isomerase